MKGVFASLIAPFGGFFASGFKRAFRIKDFGDLIPGHGGLMGKLFIQSVGTFRTLNIFKDTLYFELHNLTRFCKLGLKL